MKLGGSVITIKEKPYTANFDAIKRLAGEIQRANVKPLVTIHGGGSYGHIAAAKYHIKEGYRDASQIMGFSKTHQAMTTLNKLVVDALIDHDIPAFGMPPSSFTLMKRGEIWILGMEALKEAIKKGLVPVLYGDVAFDLDKGFNILSGDKIAGFLAVRLDAKRIIMAVDVDGILTDDPKLEPCAKLIPHITLSELEILQAKIGESRNSDVTGGMPGKMSELAGPVGCGVEALIVNALKPNNIYKALRGEKIIGTKITNK